MQEELAKEEREELILASKSRFRAELLFNAGVKAEICGAQVDERLIEADFAEKNAKISGEIPQAYPKQLALKLATEKALEVSHRFPEAVIIGCDQILELEGEVLHKAQNVEEAQQRLTALSGKTHQLQSAYAIVKNGNVVNSYVETAFMTMRSLSSDAIKSYLNKADDSVLSSVGVYQIEGIGIRLFEKIDGNYWAIIGLPLLALFQDLRKLGLITD